MLVVIPEATMPRQDPKRRRPDALRLLLPHRPLAPVLAARPLVLAALHADGVPDA
jgi:hypothetical protein